MKNYKHIKGVLLLILVFIFINGCVKQERKISNIKAFAKLYGYVRWFHPSDEAQQIDWEKFAIYGVKKVENAPDEKALKNSLLELFRPIAPSLKIYFDSEKDTFDISEITPADISAYKVIAWQHNGVELNATVVPIYESVRINRTRAKSINKMPLVFYYFNASRFHKKNIRLKLSIKGNSNDSLGIYILPIKKYKLLELSKLIKPKYFKCEDVWKQKEIKSNVRKEELIVFGVIYNGYNSVLFDNFKIELKEENEWKNIELDNLNLNSVTDNKPDVLFCSSNASYKVSSELLDSINNNYCLKIKKKKEYKLFEEYPKLGEFINKKISENLWIKLPLALWGDEKQTFPTPNIQKLIDLQHELEDEKPETYKRLGSLVITWNIFQHFYPYFEEVDLNWEKEFEIAIKDAYNDKSEHDFLNTLRKFTAKLKDGHIFIEHKSDEWHSLPIAWEWIEGKLVITKVFNKNAGLIVGDIVTKIDNATAKEYFKNVQQHISAATTGYLNYRSQIKGLMGEWNTECTLSVTGSDGNSKTIDLKHSITVSRFYKKFKNKTKYQFLENNIFYLNLDKISMPEIDSLMPKILKSNALICDLRGYPFGDVRPFLSYLLNENDTAKWLSTPKVIYPDNEKTIFNDYEGKGLKSKEPHINIPVVFITDGRAISYAESVMGIVKYYGLATIIGQATAGTNGEINNFTLPGNYNIRFTGRKAVKLNGTQHHGVGVLPDIYVNKTIKAIREDRDEFLEKAILVLNKKIRAYNTKY